MFVHMLGKFWTNSYGQNHKKFWVFWQNNGFLNHFWQSADAILEDVSVAETIIECSTINLKTTIFQYSKKLR